MEYIPDRIVVEIEVQGLPFTELILKQFPDVTPEIVSGYQWKNDFSSGQTELTKGKKILFLARQKGEAVKLCPGYSDDVLCCNYHVMNFIENCPFECTYCILQAFHNRPLMTLYVNVEEIVDRMKKFLEKHPEKYFRIGTGEHSDSLALDRIFPVNEYLIQTFSDVDNAILELKTKSADIDHLLDIDHRGNTILAWSLNPSEIVKKEELKTSSLQDRFNAAKQAADAGYKLAFHFDPLIYYNDWKNGYKEVVQMISEQVDRNKIVWISLGALRYIPSLKQIAEERFPKLSIFSEEFVPAGDGKMRYFKEIRYDLFRHMEQLFKKLLPGVTRYMCMEAHSTWKYCMKDEFKDATELDYHLAIKCKNKI